MTATIEGRAESTSGDRRARQNANVGWRDLLVEVKDEIQKDRLGIIAAGVGFYGMLAVFPALAAVVSIYGLVFDPQTVTQQLESLRGVVPSQAVDVVLEQLHGMQGDRATLGWSAAGALLITLWTSSVGVRALIKALNVTYDSQEKRGFIARAGLALLLTVSAIASAVVAVGGIVVLPVAAQFVGGGSWMKGLVQWLRWPAIAGLFGLGAAVMYRFGPCRPTPEWRDVAWGALVATVLWVLGSAAFSWYVSNFGRYNEVYGSMGAVVILLLWFLLSAFVLLVGAEINATLERSRRSGNFTSADLRTGT
ncbi:MAG: YihY/virulence factor BrkB family protein [Betaproteobacteria bacterium]